LLRTANQRQADLVLQRTDIGVFRTAVLCAVRDTIDHAWQAWRRAKTDRVRATATFVNSLGMIESPAHPARIAACGCQLCLCTEKTSVTRYFTTFNNDPARRAILRQNAHVVFPEGDTSCCVWITLN